jgi:predicted ATPase
MGLLWSLAGRATEASQSLSFAPIRTKPKRTYDQVVEDFVPEGEHIPFVLSSVLASSSGRAALEEYGRESGLFSHVEVKRLGKSPSDPVQVMVANAGRPANLIDVGYGVSQALPLVVQGILASPGTLMLLQQPEVHLHPRAQAALGSFFVTLHTTGGKDFVVETHSDYIVDRVRQEVAKGTVASADVLILYFENDGSSTTIHPISLDDLGNVQNAPPSYRDFFLHEEIELLSRGRMPT